MPKSKKAFLIFTTCLHILVACKTMEEPEPLRQIRLKSYTLSFDEANEKNVFWRRYQYDDSHKIQSITFNDTTYFKPQNQYETTETQYTYTYDHEGFLTKRTQRIQSIFEEKQSEIIYEYIDGRLDLENYGSRVTEYRYKADGTVKETIATSLITGNKQILKYNNNIPEGVIKTEGGYLQEDEDEKLYYDELLREVKYERYRNGSLYFDRVRTFGPAKSHLSSLPSFKGFPPIKDFDFRRGVEIVVTSHFYEDGRKIPVSKKIMNPIYNQEGFIIRNEGTEELELNTTEPKNRKLVFSYNYEYF